MTAEKGLRRKALGPCKSPEPGHSHDSTCQINPFYLTLMASPIIPFIYFFLLLLLPHLQTK